MLGMTLPPCCPYQPRRSVSPHQSLATIHAAFARKVRARPSGCSTLEAIWVHLRYGPVTRSPSLRDGFVNRLQDYQFPSFLLFKLRGSGLLPRWDSHPLFMPAFAGRTHFGTNLKSQASTALQGTSSLHLSAIGTARWLSLDDGTRTPNKEDEAGLRGLRDGFERGLW